MSAPVEAATRAAKVDAMRGNAQEIVDDLTASYMPQLASDYPGVSWSMEGEQKRRKDLLWDLGIGFILAMLGVYAMMAIPFKSYVQPAIVMTASKATIGTNTPATRSAIRCSGVFPD